MTRYRLLKRNRLCPHCKGDAKPGFVYCAAYYKLQYAWYRARPEREVYLRDYMRTRVRDYRAEYRRRLERAKARAA